jgi:hypothetical protein
LLSNGDDIILRKDIFLPNYSYEEIDINNLEGLLKEYYSWMYLNTIVYWNIPITKTKQVEYKWFFKKYKKLEWLNFKLSNIQHKPYDYTILDKYKVQDKTAYKRKNGNSYRLVCKKNIGFGKKEPYKENDFDFLWINLPEPFEEQFYLIPIQILIEKEYIKTSICDGRTSIGLYPHNICMFKKRCIGLIFNKYLFSYNEFNLSKFLKIL